MQTVMSDAPKILVAEDEKAMSRALELKLKRSGFEVVTVADGEAALQALSEQKFALVLLDLMMPQKDGFAVLAAMRESGNATPVIVSSNLSQEEDAERARTLGAADYFIKSNTPIEEVVQRVKKTLSLGAEI